MSISANLERYKLAVAVEEERRRREGLSGESIWRPFPNSPQEHAYHSNADITGYGGAAGGGKSEIELGLALTAHRNAIIFRREYPQLRGLIERSRELIGDKGRYNANDKIWRLDDGRTIEFGAVQHEHDVNKYRGRPHDLIAFDEATEFLEFQVRFLLGWLRTADRAQRCRVVLTFNPPTSVEGEWVMGFFAPWLDETHPNPALPGELRWYATVDGEEVERPDGASFWHEDELIECQSRTFFPARLADNPVLAATRYGATLQALPEPLRSQLLYGDFKAGLKPDAWQAIPTAWVKIAMQRWKAGDGASVPLTCIGMDIAQGGRDKTVLAMRYGSWFAPLEVYAGEETPDGNSAAAVALEQWSQGSYINVDVIGVGSSPYERLSQDHNIDAYPVNFAERSEHTDRSKKFPMRNQRAEAYWRLREALDPELGDSISLPPDSELLSDLTAYKFKITPGGVLIEDKEEVKKRIRRSTDRGDAVVLAMLPPRVFNFTLGQAIPVPKYPSKSRTTAVDEDWHREEADEMEADEARSASLPKAPEVLPDEPRRTPGGFGVNRPRRNFYGR